MTKIENFISEINEINASGTLTIERQNALNRIREFLYNLEVLIAPPFTGVPAGVQAIPQTPSAPGAVQISSGIPPQVGDGCIASLPSSVKQQTAQEQLNQLLAQPQPQPQEQLNQLLAQQQLQAQLEAQIQASKQAEFEKALAEQKTQQSLSESLSQQVITAEKGPVGHEFDWEKGAPVSAPSPAAESTVPVAPEGQMTLKDFLKKARQESIPAQFGPAHAAAYAVTPAPPAAPSNPLQAQFDAVLKEQAQEGQ